MQGFNESVQKWMSLHQECKVLVEQIGQLKSRASYLTPEHVSRISGGAVSYSRAKLRIFDDTSSHAERVREMQRDMLAAVDSLNEAVANSVLKHDSCHDSRSFTKELLEQTLLEMSLLDHLLQLDASDQDSLVTILTCFIYLPCISNLEEMDALRKL